MISMRGVSVRVSLVVISTVLVSAQGDSWPFGPLRRVSNDPVLAPQGDRWEAAGTFNPSVVSHQGSIVMLYRAQDRSGTSRLGYAISSDGLRFTRRPEPVLTPEADTSGRRRRRSPGDEDCRHLLPDVHGIQQEGRAARPGHVRRSDPLGSERRHPAGLQGDLERGMDQGGRDPARDD